MRNGLRIIVARWPCNSGHQIAQRVRETSDAGRPLCACDAHACAWLRPASRGNRHFTVGGDRLRQSGPRPEGRLLRQPALEGLMRSARTETPRKVFRTNSDEGGGDARRCKEAAAAILERGGAAHLDARVRVVC
ncbi:hypothetical protein F511_34551 [Dorcoceras hygrometricum]|uniref:Uncharacterized protein n=1 Tax=Dorcoceras hygrometricum TaxID=472368 RepID=A0A2Z7B7S3_9LAMI|nr:hypothetical protein F511_34551 [Dorcoceras hygrometricum]